jgi:hypothetical protein
MGFGGWLWLFLFAQFSPLLLFMGRPGELSVALQNAPPQTLFLLGWNVIGIVLALALAFRRNSFVVWLVRTFIIGNIVFLISMFILYSNVIDPATVIPRLLFSFIWLAYFFLSKRVKATYFITSADA